MNPLAGIRFGTATAAYQIEGGVDRDGRVPTIWDEFTTRAGNVLRGDTGTDACRTYDNPEPMLDAIAWLGVSTFRMSIAWARIITGPDGTVNAAGVAYYRRVLLALRERGVEPLVTLYHWDLPQWLQERGGWANLETATAFVHFAQTAVRELGDLVGEWVTINEPFCAAFHGHLSGEHAPGARDEPLALRTVLVQLHAHALATPAMRLLDPEARIGFAINLSDLEVASGSEADLRALAHADLVENRLFLETLLLGCLPEGAVDYFGADVVAAALEGIDVGAVATRVDFIGVNYYEHNVVRAASPGTDPIVRGIEKLPVPEPRSANGVAVRPDGFTRVLVRVARLAPEVPIRVTENGIGLFDYRGPNGRCEDAERVRFIDRYLDALADAVTQGARIEAYYFWSLMDSFEWAHGYRLRYGLFYTDFPTGRLFPKASAEHYKFRIAQERGDEAGPDAAA